MAVLLLAAGTGSRFGGAKLAAPLGGRPVVHHAARMLGELPFAERIAVCAPGGPPLGAFGFAEIVLDTEGAMMSRSIAAGIAQVGEGIEAVMIALGDMPLVPRGHAIALAEVFDGDRIASQCAGRTMPPAIFGSAWFAQLGNLEGDRGAAALLRGAPTIELPRAAALDIDRPADLKRAERALANR